MSELPFRLSQNYTPQHYDIVMDVDIPKKEYTCSVTLTLKENTKGEFLDLYADKLLKIQKVTQNNNELKFEHKTNRLLVYGSDLATSPVKIDLIGTLDRSGTGLYYINDTTCCSQLEATHAREVFPCFDEPVVKSTFKLTLTHDGKLSSIFNTPCEKTEKNGDKSTSYFQKTPPMCCYLFAIVIGTFDHIEGKTKRGLPIEIWATPDKKDYMPYALSECISYVEWYEEFTQVDFPLPRLAVCAVPDFLMGAMENFGLIIARETASLAHKEKSSKAAIMRAMMVNCHEIAHQWFGNGVSPVWWDNIWLNEGFATIFPFLVFQDIHPDWPTWEKFVNDDTRRALDFDASEKTHPIKCKVETDAQIESVFDDICYSKAGCFIRMLMFHFGYENMRSALRVYFKTYMYKNASTEDLTNVFTTVLNNKEIEPFFQNWTYQAGYPLVTLNEDGTLTQKRFTSNGLVDGQTWIIPLFIKVCRPDGKIEEVKVVFSTETMKLDIGEFKWVMLNTDMKSFCRVQYKGKYLDGIIEAVKSGKLSSIDMYSIIIDYSEFTKVGITNHGTLVTVYKAFANVTEPLPMNALLGSLKGLYNIFRGARDEIKKFMQPLCENIIAKIGMSSSPSDNLITRDLRSVTLQLLAFTLGVEKYKQYGIDLFKKFADDGSHEMPEGFDPSLLQFAFRSGSLWVEGGNMFVFKTCTMSSTPEVCQAACLSTGFVTSDKMDDCLERSINSKMQNIYHHFASISLSPNADRKLWEFFKKNCKMLKEKFGTVCFYLPAIISACLSVLYDEEGLNDAKKFFEENPIEVAENSIAKDLRDMKQDIDLAKSYTELVKKALLE